MTGATVALTLVGLALGFGALFCAVWTVAPAPHRLLAFLAVAASEWSAWVLLAGMTAAGIGMAIAFGLASGAPPPGWVSWSGSAAVLCGVLAAGISLIPPVQAWSVAAELGVPLSPFRTVMGSRDWREVSVTTVTYATPSGLATGPGAARALEMDVYREASTERVAGGKPGVVVVHGGAWNAGKRSEYPRWNRWLASRGYVVFDVDYRLAPQPNWETATGDVLCAVGRIREEAARWGIDPERLALLGRSAGAHLALLAAYESSAVGGSGTPGGAEVVSPSCEVRDVGVRAVVSLYGPADLVWGYENSANQRVINGRETLRRFLGGTPQNAAEIYRRAAPISHVRAGTPATLLLHGGRDQFAGVQHSERLAEKLRASSVTHELVLLPYAQHGFDYVFDGWGGQIAQAAIARFLDTQLKG